MKTKTQEFFRALLKNGFLKVRLSGNTSGRRAFCCFRPRCGKKFRVCFPRSLSSLKKASKTTSRTQRRGRRLQLPPQLLQCYPFPRLPQARLPLPETGKSRSFLRPEEPPFCGKLQTACLKARDEALKTEKSAAGRCSILRRRLSASESARPRPPN